MNKITSLTLYSGAVCNLRCRYCVISKNPGLSQVNNELMQCFEDDDYYFNLIDNANIDLNDIDCIELWGGEPLLFTDKIIKFLRNFINHAPNFYNLFFSSNFAHDNILNSFKLFNDLFAEFPDRKFTLSVQISIDGPEELNDAARGIGVTKKILANLHDLCDNNFYCSDNVLTSISVKPTLDIISMRNFINKDYIISYYKFFEDNIIAPIKDLNDNKIEISSYPVPNLAVPANYTAEDGKLFANILKLEQELNNEHDKYFNYYTNVMWFNSTKISKKINHSFEFNGGFCSGGYTMVGLLPNNRYCCCQKGFADYCEQYLKEFNNDKKCGETTISLDKVNDKNITGKLFCQSKKDFEMHRQRIAQFFRNGEDKLSTTLIASNTSLLISLANAGQVLEKYKDTDEAVKAVKLLLLKDGMCPYDDAQMTGCIFLLPVFKFKLFCNGALDILETAIVD